MAHTSTIGPGPIQAFNDLMDLQEEGLILGWPETRSLKNEYGFRVRGRYVSAWQTWFFYRRFMPGLKIAYIGGLVWWFIAYMNYWGWTEYALRDFFSAFPLFDWIADAFMMFGPTQEIGGIIWRFFHDSTLGLFAAYFQPVILAVAVWFILSRTLIALHRRQLLFWKQFEVVLTRDDIGVGKRLGFTGIKRVYRHAFEKARQHRDLHKKKLATWHNILVNSGEVVLTFGPQSLRIADMYLNEDMLEALQQQLLLLDRLVARA